MPVPVLLIGAGLSLSGSGSSGASSRSTGMQSSLGGRAQAFTSSARDAGAGTAERLTETAEQIQSSITSSAESVAATATEAVRTAGQVFEERREDFLRTLDRNPLLVGGIGLALGALVGAALPRTQAEREAMGDIAEDFQQRARDMAASGVEAAKDAATKVYEEAADEARRQGLSGDQVEAAARRVRDEGEAGFGAGAPSTQNRARKEQ
jgi:hypothetical protein